MRVTIFGASGAIGRHVLDASLEAHHTITALARDPAALSGIGGAHLRVIEGDIANGEDVAAAIAGSEAVISTVGPTSNTPDQVALFGAWAQHLVAGMQGHGVQRLVLLSGAAVEVPGYAKTLGDRIASAAVRLFARHVVTAKQREFEIVSASDLDWVAARPPGVVDGPRTGRYRAGMDLRLGPRSRVTRADLADFLVAQLTDDRWLRQAPFVSS